MRFKRTNFVLFVVVFEVIKRVVVANMASVIPSVNLFVYDCDWDEETLERLLKWMRLQNYVSEIPPRWHISLEIWPSTVGAFQRSEFWRELLCYLEEKGLIVTKRQVTECVMPKLEVAENEFLQRHCAPEEEMVRLSTNSSPLARE